METAALSKRIWIYIINAIVYNGIGFASALPFLLVIKLHVFFYVLIGLGFATVIAFVLGCLILKCTKGYTLASAFFRVKFVSSDGGAINSGQILIRATFESITIFALFDLIYFLKNQTERGAIDRLSDSFAIDNNL